MATANGTSLDQRVGLGSRRPERAGPAGGVGPPPPAVRAPPDPPGPRPEADRGQLPDGGRAGSPRGDGHGLFGRDVWSPLAGVPIGGTLGLPLAMGAPVGDPAALGFATGMPLAGAVGGVGMAVPGAVGAGSPTQFTPQQLAVIQAALAGQAIGPKVLPQETLRRRAAPSQRVPMTSWRSYCGSVKSSRKAAKRSTPEPKC